MCDLSICRVCLNTDVRGYKIDEHNLKSYYEYVARKKVSSKDGLPQWLCYECAMMLHKFHKFKEKCFRGQITLKQILCRGPLSYESVALLNRYSEKLVSSVGIAMTNKRVKCINIKHKSYMKPKFMEVEKVMINDSEDSMKIEDTVLVKDDTSLSKITVTKHDIKIATKEIDENVEIKTEPPLPVMEPLKTENHASNDNDMDKNDIGITFDHIVNTNNDLINTNTDICNISNTNNDLDIINDDMDNTDNLDNTMSSDDENIFLDIVKKAVKGENKLVFLEGIEVEPKVKKKKHPEKSRTKPQKFEKPKKEYLNPQYWRKYNLNEEDAMQEFRQREHSDKYVNANYKCHNCLKGFSKVDMLMRHVKFRHDESLGPMECRFCHMRFRQKNQLCKHIKQHYAVYHCLRCDTRFRLENSAIFHEDYHNGVIRKCKHCGEEFRHSSTYYTHLRMSHRSAHVCAACGASFVSAAGLQQHRRIKHYGRGDDASNEATDATNAYCEKCDIKFESQAAYDEHLTHSNMHGDLTADPDVTRRNMKGNKSKMIDRKGPRRKKPTTCQYCGKHFTTQASCMKHHQAEHPRRTFYPPDKRHICEVCGVSLAAVSIASHMNRHTREHVYPCDTCGMQFISKSSHHRHQVTHTGERPYPCPLCEKRFTQKNSMKLHYRTFHLKQPYPKRNRRKKTDLELPIMECAMNRSRSDIDSNSNTPIARWRATL